MAWLLLAGSPGLHAVDLSLQPNPLLVGQEGALTLRSAEGELGVPALPKVPGLSWAPTPSSSRSMQIINGQVTAEYLLVYRFQVGQAGTYTIPPFTVQVGNKKAQTPPLQLTVQERQLQVRGKKLRLEDLVVLRVRYGAEQAEKPPAALFPGQALPLTIKLYVPQVPGVELARRQFQTPARFFPTAELQNVVFRDYGEQNHNNSKFLYDIGEGKFEGNTCYVATYQACISPVAAGTIEGVIQQQVPLVDPRSRQRGNDFDFFFGRTVEVFDQPVQVTIGPITVKPLPPNPHADTPFLGLIGQGQVQFALDRTEVKVGEAVALTVTATGFANVEAAVAPKLAFPQFSVYEPETTTASEPQPKVVLRWAMVPRTTEAALPELAFVTFDPTTETYQRQACRPVLKILPNPDATAAAAAATPPLPPRTPPTVRPTIKTNDILYLKTDLAAVSPYPWWGRGVWLPLVLLLLGPVAWGAVLCLAARRDRLAADPAYRRRREARQQRGRLLRAVRDAAPEQLPALVRDEVVPYLKALYDLPPGATTAELLARVPDPELATMLTEAEASSFRSQQATGLQAAAVARKLAALGCLMAGLLLLNVAGANPAGQSLGAPLTPAAAAAAYDRQDFATALDVYQALLRQQGPNAALYYNLGNCFYGRNELGWALLCYERARRLAPRDSDTLENLDFVRSKLNLPPAQAVENPVDLLRVTRDRLRPDEWLLLAGAAWTMAWLGLGWCRWRGRRFHALLLLPLAGGVLAGVAWFAQVGTSYAHEHAIVVVKDTPLRRLPAVEDAPARELLAAGEQVTIAEERADWVRVRLAQAEGWVPRPSVERVWP